MAERLRGCEKERAENVMIVDMMRNDLGRIAEGGSVRVDTLFEVERYPTVLQMTSTVSCRTGVGLSAIFEALFPCASVTGAPKHQTMHLIERLEKNPRGLYTGAIGHIAPRRRAVFSVAIRTAVIDKNTGRASYGTGGGIVADSRTDAEYEECLLKTRVLRGRPPAFRLVETMRWTPLEGFFLLDFHLQRLLGSAAYFGVPCAEGAVRDHLAVVAASQRSPVRVRLLVDQEGGITHESGAMPVSSRPVVLGMAQRPVDTADPFLFHKTTNRTVYDRALDGLRDVQDAVLWNDRGAVTETTIGNIVVELDGRLCTPAISCGLLAGVFRRHLLDKGRIFEAIISCSDLSRAGKIFRINAVRGWEACRLAKRSS